MFCVYEESTEWFYVLSPAAILYELLYDDVFKVERNLLGSCQRVARPTDLLSDDNMAACASSDESDLDAGEALWWETYCIFLFIKLIFVIMRI